MGFNIESNDTFIYHFVWGLYICDFLYIIRFMGWYSDFNFPNVGNLVEVASSFTWDSFFLELVGVLRRSFFLRDCHSLALSSYLHVSLLMIMRCSCCYGFSTWWASFIQWICLSCCYTIASMDYIVGTHALSCYTWWWKHSIVRDVYDDLIVALDTVDKVLHRVLHL